MLARRGATINPKPHGAWDDTLTREDIDLAYDILTACDSGRSEVFRTGDRAQDKLQEQSSKGKRLSLRQRCKQLELENEKLRSKIDEDSYAELLNLREETTGLYRVIHRWRTQYSELEAEYKKLEDRHYEFKSRYEGTDLLRERTLRKSLELRIKDLQGDSI